jgi:hypothetical protein
MKNVTDLAKMINDFLNKGTTLNNLAEETQFIRRKRKIKAKEFLKSGIMTVLSTKESTLEDFVLHFEDQGSKQLSKQSLSKRFTKECVDFLEKVSQHLWKKNVAQKFSFLELERVESIIVCDSTEIQLPDTAASLFKGLRNKMSVLKIQTTMDVLQGCLKKWEFTAGNIPDQGYRGDLEYLSPNSLFIGDLGYFSLDRLSYIIKNSGFFLMRYFKRTAIYYPNGTVLDLFSLLKKSPLSIIDIPVVLGVSQVPCRLIATPLTRKQLSQRKNILKKKRKRDPRMNQSMPSNSVLDRWSILITNLDSSQISASQTWPLYACRWQIELFFKFLKSKLHIHSFSSSNVYRIQAEIHLKLIASYFLLLLLFASLEFEPSMTKALKVFKKFLHGIFSNSYTKILSSLRSALHYLLSYSLKEHRRSRSSSKQALSWALLSS